MKKYILSIDQGTTSSRAILFNRKGEIITKSQYEHEQIFPAPGLVEHNPEEIIINIKKCISDVLRSANITSGEIAAIGVTNQRETTLVWDRKTGRAIHNAIVWQDTRASDLIKKMAEIGGINKYKDICGLPLANYFSAPKIKWLLENVEGAKQKAQNGDLIFGTMDSWVIWNLTGGVNGGVHVTDVTNASRTMLMNLKTLKWQEEVCKDMGVPVSMLPEIKSSSEIYGTYVGQDALNGVAIAGILGDQQAATFGQACFGVGMAKNTYGTGCFTLMNTGDETVFSKNGLLTTVAYQLKGEKPQYALEGSVAVAGSLIQWLRDNLQIINSAEEVEELAKSVPDNGGVYFVPAFSGLFAPHWRDDARGAILGMTRYNNKAHIARAALEASAFQSKEVLKAMEADAGIELQELRVDGGMVANTTLMQFQSDILGKKVVAPQILETTALGAAYVAGIAVGFWRDKQDIINNWQEKTSWFPAMPEEVSQKHYALWQKAISKSLDWA